MVYDSTHKYHKQIKYHYTHIHYIYFRGLSRVTTQPAGGVRRFQTSRGLSRVGSGRVGSGRVGSGRVGSGRVGSGRVGWGRVGWGRVGWGGFRVLRVGAGHPDSDPTGEKFCDPFREEPCIFPISPSNKTSKVWSTTALSSMTKELPYAEGRAGGGGGRSRKV